MSCSLSTPADRATSISGDIFTRAAGRLNLKAWEPWEFTRSILFEFQNSDIDDEHWEWRLNWFAGVALLRTIGHVLYKVDAKRSDGHRTVIRSMWKSWHDDRRQHWIFFDFIERERNNILKEFSFGAELPSANDQRVLAYADTHDDAAQLFREAVYWWRDQLEVIETGLADHKEEV
jgi:hypothetical protein